jgi:hypothetical protein
MTRLTNAAAPTARSKSVVVMPEEGAPLAVPLVETEEEREVLTELADVDVVPEEELEVWAAVVVTRAPAASEA